MSEEPRLPTCLSKEERCVRLESGWTQGCTGVRRHRGDECFRMLRQPGDPEQSSLLGKILSMYSQAEEE